jgi:hypothetical protein
MLLFGLPFRCASIFWFVLESLPISRRKCSLCTKCKGVHRERSKRSTLAIGTGTETIRRGSHSPSLRHCRTSTPQPRNRLLLPLPPQLLQPTSTPPRRSRPSAGLHRLYTSNFSSHGSLFDIWKLGY